MAEKWLYFGVLSHTHYNVFHEKLRDSKGSEGCARLWPNGFLDSQIRISLNWASTTREFEVKTHREPGSVRRTRAKEK